MASCLLLSISAVFTKSLALASWQAAPSLLWLNQTDQFIQGIWLFGAFCAVVAMTGIVWRPALLVCFVCYLSLLNGSQEFLGYQWDILLLEAGFLSLFLGYSKVVVWLFRWLLFRLMFLSGAVKLLSGDPTWHSLSALMVHFQTQPIPTPLAWYANQLPHWFLQLSCALVFVIELVLPFFVFGPRRVRMIAALGLIGLQLLIILTGNYAFFNWLSLALCLFLFDDAQVERWLHIPWSNWFTGIRRSFLPERLRKAIAGAFSIIIVGLSTLFFIQTVRAQWLPSAARSLISTAAPFGITSSYGLFANHDHNPAGDHYRRLHRRGYVAAVRIQIQTRTVGSASAMGRTASTTARLANVVCSTWKLSGECMVSQPARTSASG